MSPAQFTDPAVSRKKFNREIAEFRSLRDQYSQQGWFLVRAKYPHALVILATSKTNPITIFSGVFFDYTNYDAVPPSVRLVHPMTGKPYKSNELPSQLPRTLPSQQINLVGAPDGAPPLELQQQGQLMQAHDPNDIPFLCLAGVREYHEHPAHSGDHWEMHRPSGAGRLIRLIEIISKYGWRQLSALVYRWSQMLCSVLVLLQNEYFLFHSYVYRFT